MRYSRLLAVSAMAVALALATTACTSSGASSAGPSNSAKANGPATNYPNKTITIIVPFAAGGGTDIVGRAIAHSLQEQLKVNVIVENKTGGSGAVGLQAGVNAKPNGYTLTLFTGEVVTLPAQGTAQFSPLDFDYIATVNYDPSYLTVPANSPAKTAQELVNLLKKKKGAGVFSASVVPDLRSQVLQKYTGLKYRTVPYEGAAPAIKSLLSGQGDFGFFNAGEIQSQVAAGTVRLLGVLDSQPSHIFPKLGTIPTLASVGVTQTAASITLRGLAAPKGTPKAIIAKLATTMKKVAKSAEFVSFMKKSVLGLRYLDSAQTLKLIKQYQAQVIPLLKASAGSK